MNKEFISPAALFATLARSSNSAHVPMTADEAAVLELHLRENNIHFAAADMTGQTPHEIAHTLSITGTKSGALLDDILAAIGRQP